MDVNSTILVKEISHALRPMSSVKAKSTRIKSNKTKENAFKENLEYLLLAMSFSVQEKCNLEVIFERFRCLN